MKFIFKNLALMLFCTVSVFSQTKDETIGNVRKLIAQKEFNKAENTLHNYYSNHSDDLETNWLYAQVAHWNNNNGLSATLFNKAISIAPKNNIIQLDYARMLYETSDFNKALTLINQIKKDKEVQAEALLMEAHIYFWLGNSDKANATIATFKKIYPTSNLTEELEKSIKNTTATYVNAEFEYQSDNQPMKYFGEKLKISKYFSNVLHPEFEIKNYSFNPSQQSLEAQIGNEFSFVNLALKMKLNLGIYKNFNDSNAGICGIEINKKIAKKSNLQLGFSKKPYLGTLVSTTYTLLQNNIYTAMDIENCKYIAIHVGYNNQYFEASNTIHTFSSWIISKAKPNSIFSTQFGYGFSYADSKTNLFESNQTLATAIANFGSNSTIDGVYNPYFTPKNQIVHALIGIVNYKPTKELSLSLKGNYGFYATCDNPYIYLDTDVLGNTVFTKSYYKANFNPSEIKGIVSYAFSSKFEASLAYNYQHTFFYNRNNATLSLNYQF